MNVMINDAGTRLKYLQRVFLVVVISGVLLTSLHHLWPTYFPHISPAKLFELALERQLENLLAPILKPAASIPIEINEDHYYSPDLGITLDRPTGWHMYLNSQDKSKSLIVQKETLDFAETQYSPYFVIIRIGDSYNYPPNAVSEAMIKSFKKEMSGFFMKDKRIANFREGFAIKIGGEYGGKHGTNSLACFIAEQMKQTYVMYYVWPANLNLEDIQTLEKIPLQINFGG